MSDAFKALYDTYPSCLRSGYCCKQAPCPFGEADPTTGHCIHLVGDKPGFYGCAIYEDIIGKPGAELCPAFGAGCPSTLFNEDRVIAKKNLKEAQRVRQSSRQQAEQVG